MLNVQPLLLYCHFLTIYFRVPLFFFHDSEHRLKAPLILFSLSIVQRKLVYTLNSVKDDFFFFFVCRKFLRSNNLQLSKNHQLHHINQASYKFYVGVWELFVYRELHLNNHIFCKCWRIFLNTLELWLWFERLFYSKDHIFFFFVNLMLMVIDNVMHLIIYFYVNIMSVWRHSWCC